ncbi:MAG: UvrD-helicase domain-containing protein [Candidatus Latescibacteria bacterium]|nr:UvrD-helicase domain-containing protein [Candidatus Latescibacterota bacterium]
MRFVADIHLHSRYARATSRDLNPENLHRWSALKGITVVGTGDFTHPAWLAELQEQLEPAEEGLYRLKDTWRIPVEAQLPPSCLAEVRFVLSVEISSIYKKNGRTRKVHNVVVMPGFAEVEALNRRLGAIGNLKSDGRPILGLDSRDLLEICLEVCPEVLFIPAHIWTPHFAALGSASGFDSLEECYEDLLPHIPAVETGLSSDPPMNSRIAELDRFALVSNSDAHSPQKLAREGTCFDTDLSYSAMLAALRSRDPAQFTGTLEFYPEEGKYHCDGHRNCQVRWRPAQTLAAGGRCPVCGQQLTVGVLHRVELLADRPEGEGPKRPCEYLIPLPEVIGSALGSGPASKRVQAVYQHLLASLGPELYILRHATPEAIAATGEHLVAEGVRRMRTGQVQIAAGYDGEYGVIQLFTDEERQQLKGQKLLFALPASTPAPQAPTVAAQAPSPNTPEPAAVVAPDLDPAQQQAVEMEGRPVVVVAGPGSGKTRTLTQRIAHLIGQRGVAPGQILALTFTRRAAAELRQRLETLLGDGAALAELHVGTFHQVALQLMADLGLPLKPVLDEWESRQLLSRALAESGVSLSLASAHEGIMQAKAHGQKPEELADEKLGQVYAAYQEQLARYEVWDYDQILLDFLDLLETSDEDFSGRNERPGDDSEDMIEGRGGDPEGLLERQGNGPEGFSRGVAGLGSPRGWGPGSGAIASEGEGRAWRKTEVGHPLARPSLGFTQVLVDEFQDLNLVQYQIVRSLAGSGEGLFVIGDPDQAIYGFRGADASCFARLLADYPAAHLVHLEVNYRCAAPIVQAAAALITHNPGRQPLHLRPARQGGAQLRLLSVPGEKAEGIAVVQEISRMVGGADMVQSDRQSGRSKKAHSLADFGVLFRTHAQAQMLEECFLHAGLPYHLLGEKSFLAAPPVRQALAFLRFVLQPEEPLRLLQALELPAFNPGPQAINELARKLTRPVAAETLPEARTLCAAAAEYRRLAEQETPAALVRRYQQEYGQDEDLSRLTQLAEQANSLEELLATVALGVGADYERRSTNVEAVRLLTLHAARGLEFEVVFLCGMEEGLLPLNGATLEEERRLCYVGLTRAREELVLVAARSRQQYGQRLESALSSFVRELPAALLVKETIEPPRRAEAEQLSLF